MAYNKNKITSMELQATTPYDLTESGFKTGYPTSALFSYKHAGLDENGRPLWYTVDGRKVGNIENESPDVLIFSGQSEPKVNLGMENTFRYKGFSLNFMMVYYGGHKMRVRQYYEVNKMPFGPIDDYYIGSWTPENTETNVPGIGQYGTNVIRDLVNECSDIFVQPADFIKVRNIVFGYSLPHEFIKRLGINHLALSFQIDNPRTLWQKNDMKVDPETKSIRRQTSYIIGLNFNF